MTFFATAPAGRCRRPIEREVEDYIQRNSQHLDEDGHRLVVRNGHHPARKIQSGNGPIEVRQPRVNDKRVDEQGNRFRFTSKILPPYLRKTKAIEELVPWLYLKGISTSDFPEALGCLGHDGSGLSPTSIVRMKELWQGAIRELLPPVAGGQALRLPVGRRHLLQHPPERRPALRAGFNGRNGGWDQGTDRHDRRPARERAELAGTAAGRQELVG